MAINLKVLTCKNCGEPLNLSDTKNNIIKCKYCSTEHVLPKDDTPEEAKLYLHDGQRALDVGNFDEALTCFDKALEIEPIEPEGYFGKFLAKHKVQYLKDIVNNRLQPIVHELIDKDILEDNDYKKACRFANNDQKEIYQRRVEEIDHIKKSFMELEKSNLDYDCFICVKVTDDETKFRTKDSRNAEKIYDVLRRKGYKPFYSEIEIKGRTGSDYEAMILYALMKSECMLVVCSNEEYLNTKWVKNEYTRFLKLVNDEVKSSDAITIVFDKKPIEKLPGKKGKIQGINLDELDVMETIENYVYNHTPKAKAEREAQKRAKLEEENELKKQLAEQAELIKKLQEQKSSVDLSSINILELIEKAQKEKVAKESLVQEQDDDDECEGVFIFDDDNKNKLVEYIGESDEVKIPDFVTIIGEKAFSGCDYVTSIIVPSSVKRIDDYAFSDCSFLTTINIPSSVTSIGNYAFSGCKSLTTISIPNSVKKFGEHVFEFCTSLTSIDLPSSITNIGARTFESCTSLESIKIPDSVTSIGDHSFYRCTSLKSVFLSNNLKIIADSAFRKCSGLTSIVIPSSVTSIGSFAFQNCSLLTTITIPYNVTKIGDSAFSNCSSLTINCEISVKPNGWHQYWNYSNRPVVWFCNKPKNKDQIENESKEEVINKQEDKRIAAIRNGFVFDEKDKNKLIKYVGKSSEVEIPDFVTSIGQKAFMSQKSIKSIVIPRSVTSIGDFAFCNCASLTSITIPNSVASIGKEAFHYCRSLTSIVIPKSVARVGSSAFFTRSLTIYCEASSKPSEWNTNCTSDSPVYWGINESNYLEQDGLIYVIVDNTAVVTGHSANITNVVIPSTITINGTEYNVTSIGKKAFHFCSSLISITIPSSVTCIGYGAFWCCESLTSVKFEDNSKLVSIEASAFFMCSSLFSIILPNSVTSIEIAAFSSCSSLTSIEIPNSVTSMGEFIFLDCSKLEIIRCLAKKKPLNWKNYWNYKDGYKTGFLAPRYKVKWGYKK